MSHIPGEQLYQVEVHFLDPKGQLTLELTTYVQGSRLCCFCLHSFPTFPVLQNHQRQVHVHLSSPALPRAES